MDYQIINEQSIMIKFEPQIDPETFKKVQQILKYLETESVI